MEFRYKPIIKDREESETSEFSKLKSLKSKDKKHIVSEDFAYLADEYFKSLDYDGIFEFPYNFILDNQEKYGLDNLLDFFDIHPAHFQEYRNAKL